MRLHAQGYAVNNSTHDNELSENWKNNSFFLILALEFTISEFHNRFVLCGSYVVVFFWF